VRDAAPKSVPVWVFGHGLCRRPARTSTTTFLDLVDRAGAVVVAPSGAA
jgi:hypothetical protein